MMTDMNDAFNFMLLLRVMYSHCMNYACMIKRELSYQYIFFILSLKFGAHASQYQPLVDHTCQAKQFHLDPNELHSYLCFPSKAARQVEHCPQVDCHSPFQCLLLSDCLCLLSILNIIGSRQLLEQVPSLEQGRGQYLI